MLLLELLGVGIRNQDIWLVFMGIYQASKGRMGHILDSNTKNTSHHDRSLSLAKLPPINASNNPSESSSLPLVQHASQQRAHNSPTPSCAFISASYFLVLPELPRTFHPSVSMPHGCHADPDEQFQDVVFEGLFDLGVLVFGQHSLGSPRVFKGFFCYYLNQSWNLI